MPRPPSYRETEVYRAIHEYRILNGCGPTNKEIAAMTGICLSEVPKYMRILEGADLIERERYKTRSVRIKGAYTAMRTERGAVIFEDGRKSRALRGEPSPRKRADAARKGLANRRDRKAFEAACIEAAVKLGQERDAGQTSTAGVDYVHDYRRRGSFRAWRVG